MARFEVFFFSCMEIYGEADCNVPDILQQSRVAKVIIRRQFQGDAPE